MTDPSPFEQLLEQAVNGNERAQLEFFHSYKDSILRAARTRMRNGRLRRTLDSEEIVNTVMKSFFARIDESDWKLDTEEDLLKLLGRMARNKVIDRARKLSTEKHGGQSTEVSIDGIVDVASDTLTPDEIVAIRELTAKAWEIMSPELRELYTMRFEEKLGWDIISTKFGAGLDACRKKMTRGFEEVAQQLRESK